MGRGMPRRWQMKRVKAASWTRQPGGMTCRRKMEAVPRAAVARRRAEWRGARSGRARRPSRSLRWMAWAKTIWLWRLGMRRRQLMEGTPVDGSMRSEWTLDGLVEVGVVGEGGGDVWGGGHDNPRVVGVAEGWE